ncbi:MAG: hypothetical protein LN414_08125 [Candidatus Thermoplasmatota archaeon]|nr:hypothetical protein [Candidatus Thermoplasmatota archaeon]
MRGRNGIARSWSALLVVIMLAQLSTLLIAEDGPVPVDPFGPAEGPIPFPIFNVSSSYDEDRFPYVYTDPDSIRVIWNKGARDMFVYQVVQREFDGDEWQKGVDWVSVIDTQDQDFVAHEHYSHEGMAVQFNDLVYFVFASDDPNYTTGTEHDIVLRYYDPETGRTLGYHVHILGWAEILEPHGETSLAEIKESVIDMVKGDQLMARAPEVQEIAIQASPQAVEGQISFLAAKRTLVATLDYVYLNRGTLDGLEVGSPLEVYRKGYMAREEVRDARVQIPDRVVADLLVVKAQPEASVALIRHTEEALSLGDRFRGMQQ